MSTSAITFYGLLEAATSKRPVPAGLCFDKDGKPTTDAGVALEGSVKTFEPGHKGSGLALLVEMLAGAMVGAAVPPGKEEADSWGHFFLAFRPDLLVGPTQVNPMQQRFAALLNALKNVKPTPGSEIFTPGERGQRIYDRN